MRRRRWRLVLMFWRQPERQRRADFRLAYRVLSGKIIPIIALIGLVWLIVAVLANAGIVPTPLLTREAEEHGPEVARLVREFNGDLSRGAVENARRFILPSVEQVDVLRRFGRELSGGAVVAEPPAVRPFWDANAGEFRFRSVSRFCRFANGTVERFIHRVVWARRNLRAWHEWVALSQSFERGEAAQGVEGACAREPASRSAR